MESGYAGLGLAELQPGNLIWIPAGGHMLYMVRPVPGAAHPSTFKLVGDCYVQGVTSIDRFECLLNVPKDCPSKPRGEEYVTPETGDD